MARILPPCGKKCPNRTQTCHSECEAYLAYRARLDEANKQRQDAQAKMLDASAVRRAAVIRANKQKRQKPCMKKGKPL